MLELQLGTLYLLLKAKKLLRNYKQALILIFNHPLTPPQMLHMVFAVILVMIDLVNNISQCTINLLQIMELF